MRLTPVALAVLCLLAAGCGDGDDEGVHARERGVIDGVQLHPGTEPPATTPDTATAPTDPTDTSVPERPGDDLFGWSDQGDDLEDGYLEVPLDHADPQGDTIRLYVVRHRALDPANRIGTLLVNPGGPGFGGTDLVWGAETIYDRALLDRFDIVGWDPRGTGFSEPAIDCIVDYDTYFGVDASPDTPQEKAQLVDLATKFGAGCEQRSGDLLPHMSTADSARDMDAIRQALGEDTISYFGFSYGSELGATWATMFPDTVRAAVLDGAVDPTVGYFEQNVQQAAGFEAAFDTFLAECSADSRCPFRNGGDAAGAFDRLYAAVDETPVEVDPDRTPVTQGVLSAAIASALYDEASWPTLAQALADLQDGDGQAILGLYDDYYGYYGDEQWDDSMEAYFAVGCLDDPGSTGPDDLYSREGELAAAAPRLGRSWLLELTICSVWPEAQATPVVITGAGAGQILVMGTTGDTATPLAGTRRMAQALQNGRLVVVAANQHTGYGVDQCGDRTVDDYLIDPTAPLPAETDCT